MKLLDTYEIYIQLECYRLFGSYTPYFTNVICNTLINNNAHKLNNKLDDICLYEVEKDIALSLQNIFGTVVGEY